MRAPASPRALARRLRMAMGDQRVSRKGLAGATGISRPALSRKLDGQGSFTYEELLAIIAALGIDWEALLAGGDDEDPPDRYYRLRDFSPRPDRPL
ncbi:helix-turn-helix domain-containing protein [Mycobacterium avium]|uniref:helix-turn-helix domain-containing protein n=1 Tax=Mycobacterium avium TaxID=1764 RepID=UPI001157918A